MIKSLSWLAIVSLFSCTHKLVGTTYAYADTNRAMSIKFTNDTLCEIQQKIFCKKIDTQYQNKRIWAKYEEIKFNVKYYKLKGPVVRGREKAKKYHGIVVSNLNCESCEKQISIIGYLDNDCLAQSDTVNKKIAGKINNFLHDTLIVDRRVIYFGPFKATLVNK